MTFDETGDSRRDAVRNLAILAYGPVATEQGINGVRGAVAYLGIVDATVVRDAAAAVRGLGELIGREQPSRDDVAHHSPEIRAYFDMITSDASKEVAATARRLLDQVAAEMSR